MTIRSGNLGGSKGGRGIKCEILFGNRKGTQSREGSIGVLGLEQHWGFYGCIVCWAMSNAGESADASHAEP